MEYPFSQTVTPTYVDWVFFGIVDQYLTKVSDYFIQDNAITGFVGYFPLCFQLFLWDAQSFVFVTIVAVCLVMECSANKQVKVM
ncbi:hypothetical protein BWR59_12530 [Pseudomonas sp. Bc-h]|nr:hypothetical protein BWR59_12530 [Pseudomonas sp. Bc-h]